MATTCREVTPPARVHHRLHKAAGRWGGDDDSELDVFAAERYFNGDDALSSSFSSAFRTGTHEHGLSSLATVTAATSSSEASWNSRSGLLPDGKVAAAAAPGIEAEPRADGKPSSSHLRRWMLGVAAGCACIGVVGGQEEELVTNDDETGKLFGRRGESKEEEFLAVGEATSVRVMPGRWLDDGDEFLAEKAAFSPVPPSEVSVVWSVATAEGAASCNFSSAASGYYYHHHINPAGEDDDARRRNRRRRRSGAIANSGGGLLTCIGDKAVDTVGGATVGARHGGRNGARR